MYYYHVKVEVLHRSQWHYHNSHLPRWFHWLVWITFRTRHLRTTRFWLKRFTQCVSSSYAQLLRIKTQILCLLMPNSNVLHIYRVFQCMIKVPNHCPLYFGPLEQESRVQHIQMYILLWSTVSFFQPSREMSNIRKHISLQYNTNIFAVQLTS